VKYDAIIFDLDGTAVPSTPSGMPSKQIVDIVDKSKNDIHLCAATGRSWQMASRIINALELVDPCIVSGGAMIIDPIQETILWEETIPGEVVRKLLSIAKSHGFDIAYAKGLDTVVNHDPHASNLSGALNVFYFMNVPMRSADIILGEISSIPEVTVSKALSWELEGGVDLHVTNKNSTKEHAVIELCKILDIDREKAAGVGDGHNDIHLFNAVGTKVAMGNAVLELKEAADLVIKSLEEDGLADFINKTVGKSTSANP
jgi:HAD superfamily hydrolase (TIGR01484 family)